jgi:hypothetical protein
VGFNVRCPTTCPKAPEPPADYSTASYFVTIETLIKAHTSVGTQAPSIPLTLAFHLLPNPSANMAQDLRSQDIKNPVDVAEVSSSAACN